MPSDNPKEPLEKQRGLLIHSDYIGRFLDPNNPKTAEVRNFACRVLKPNHEFYLVESGLKDSNRRGVWRIWAKAMFTGNTFVTHENLEEHFSQHRLTRKEYDSLSSKWFTDKGGFTMWGVKIIETMVKTPMYVAAKGGEDSVESFAS